MEKGKLARRQGLRTSSGFMFSQSDLWESINNFFHNFISKDITKEGLKEPLCELEKLVENRTRLYVKTIEQLNQENIRRLQTEKLLIRRDTILKAVSSAAGQLMLNNSWQSVAQDILQQLGQAAEVSRVCIFQNHSDNQRGESLTSLLYKWTASDSRPQSGNSELHDFPFEKNGFGQWRKILDHGGAIYGLVKEFPKAIRKALLARDIQSIAIVPIRIKNKLWGFMNFDHCHLEYQWSEMEIEALKMSANILGAAIERKQLEEVLRKSRAHYRAVVDSQNEMICRYKIDGTLTFVNDAYCLYLGKKRQELIGGVFFPFNNLKEREKIVQLVTSLDSDDNPIGTLEHSHIMPDNEIHWHKWTYRKINDGKNHPAEYQAVGLNITDQRRAEQELQKVLVEQEELIAKRTADLRLAFQEMAQREKMTALGIMTSEIAHEINNPNSFITFNIPILEEYIQELLSIFEYNVASKKDIELFGLSYPEFKEDMIRLLKSIHNGSIRINATISRLRTFARPQKADEMQQVDLKTILEQSIELCRTKIMKTVKSLEMDIPKNLPKILTKPFSLEQILINLLINAAQSANKKDSWIKVKVSLEKIPKGHLSIIVEDNGCGMDENTQRIIFAPFFTTKAQGGGTGLGLFVSNRLVKEIGGCIKVESELGKGSRFQVIIPKKQTGVALKKSKQPNRLVRFPLKNPPCVN